MIRTAQNRGQILNVYLPGRIPAGHEQTGSRPCVLLADPSEIQPLRFPLVIVAPLTTKSLDMLPLYPRLDEGMGNLPLDSTVLLDQIIAVDIHRVRGYIGKLTEQEYAPIQKGLLLMFDSWI